MTIPRVLIHSDQPELALDVLEQTHPDISPSVCTDYKNLANCVEKHKPEIVFSCRFSTQQFPRRTLVENKFIKWVSNAGSGVNHLMPWEPEKIIVTNSAGVAADMMAEYALGIMLYFSLDLSGILKDQKLKDWRYRQVTPLYQRTLLILGLGKTGQAMAPKAKALDMNVIGIRARPRPTDYVDTVYATDDLHKALSQADYVLVCLPLLESTTGLIGDKEFDSLKNGAVLIDVSRGGIVQQQALLKALENGRLAGAGLDVFETEPLPKDNPLWSYENVLISPHCCSVYDGWEKQSARMFAQNLTRWRNGEKLLNVVDPDRGY